MKSGISILAVAFALVLPGVAQAQLAVSANDGKQLRPGEAPSSRTPDSVAVIDMSQTPPKVVGTVAAPALMIGPPTSVAVASDSSFALVASAQKMDGDEIVKNDVISVIDLANPAAPRVVQTVHAGAGATGVAINKAGTLALVANTGSDTISVFSIAGKRLTKVGDVPLAYQSRPTDVSFSPDGKTALAVAQSDGELIKLAVNGTSVTKTGIAIKPGVGPYGAVISRDGRYAYNTNLGGPVRPAGAARPSGPTISSVSVVDLQSNSVVSSVDVGMTSEHVELSPDGKFLAVVVANGSAAAPGSPTYHDYGLLQVYRVEGATLVRAAEAHTGQWCQGAAWSKDSRHILLQCAMTKDIETFDFDGKSALTRNEATKLKFDARPGAISSGLSR